MRERFIQLARYYLQTAHGMITTGVVVGFVLSVFNINKILLPVMIAAWLLREARIEQPAIVVVPADKFNRILTTSRNRRKDDYS